MFDPKIERGKKFYSLGGFITKISPHRLTIDDAMITLRIDVDYPYTSRPKSFLSIALRVKSTRGTDYLKNARIIAQMINESQKEVKAYWFFTHYTIPDQRLLNLLGEVRHEVALHVATQPFREWRMLEEKTNRKIKYYTMHGTAGFLNQLLWGRKLSEAQPVIPKEFPLISFHDFKTMSLDRERYLYGYEGALKETETFVHEDIVMSIHPDWLFNQTVRTQRGAYYDVLKTMLDVDNDIEAVRIRKAVSVKIARDFREYHKKINPSPYFLSKLSERGIDVFTFIERRWCCPISKPSLAWVKSQDNIALLEINDYLSWMKLVGKKTRNLIRKAERDGVKLEVLPQNEKLAEGIYRVYNETPIRQGRAFPHYGETMETVSANIYAEKESTFIGAYIGEEMAGFIQILHGDNVAILSNIISMQKYRDQSVNNALLAKAVEVCAFKRERWLMYGRMGNHPSLDKFKVNNGFVKYPVARYFIPLTPKGRFAIKLGLHRELKDSMPDFIKYQLLPLANWVSRTKVRVKFALKN